MTQRSHWHSWQCHWHCCVTVDTIESTFSTSTDFSCCFSYIVLPNHLFVNYNTKCVWGPSIKLRMSEENFATQRSHWQLLTNLYSRETLPLNHGGSWVLNCLHSEHVPESVLCSCRFWPSASFAVREYRRFTSQPSKAILLPIILMRPGLQPWNSFTPLMVWKWMLRATSVRRERLLLSTIYREDF